jgi:hypothetical protein
MAGKRAGGISLKSGDAGYVSRPSAKMQGKRDPKCCECGALPSGHAIDPGWPVTLHLEGWRYRDSTGALLLVCPDHVKEGDW